MSAANCAVTPVVSLMCSHSISGHTVSRSYLKDKILLNTLSFVTDC